ncbi:MAG: hypothetical protein WAU07_03615, partial [Microgenomates group bacterium]
MKNFAIVIFICAIGALAFFAYSINTKQGSTAPDPTTKILLTSPTTENMPPQEVGQDTDLPVMDDSGTAAFAIYTNNTFRIFTNNKYHFQNREVYLSPENPNLVHFSRTVTWQEFFDTLPFSVSETCLITGTGQE